MIDLMKKSTRKEGKTYLFMLIIEAIVGLILWSNLEVEPGQTLTLATVFVSMYGIGFLATVYSCIMSFTSYKSSNVYKSLKQYGDPESLISKIDNDIKENHYLVYNHQEELNNVVLLTNEYFLILNKNVDRYLLINQILWAYYGNESGNYATLYIWTHDKKHSIQTTLLTSVIKPLLSEMQKLSIQIGYDDELKKLRDRSYKKFVDQMSGNK